MTDLLDAQIRRVMRQLSEQAPMPPSVEELQARHAPARPRRVPVVPLVAAAVVALAAALVVAPARTTAPTRVTVGGSTAAPADVRLSDLVVTYVPAGFVLEDDQTENVPASVDPDPQAPGVGAPQGSAGTQRSERYNRGTAPGERAVIYVTAINTPAQVQTLDTLRALVRNSQATTVAGKPAVLGLPAPGDAATVDIRWVESPHVVVMVTSRGPVDAEEVRRMADGVTFAGPVPNGAAPPRTVETTEVPGATTATSLPASTVTPGPTSPPTTAVVTTTLAAEPERQPDQTTAPALTVQPDVVTHGCSTPDGFPASCPNVPAPGQTVPISPPSAPAGSRNP